MTRAFYSTNIILKNATMLNCQFATCLEFREENITGSCNANIILIAERLLLMKCKIDFWVKQVIAFVFYINHI